MKERNGRLSLVRFAVALALVLGAAAEGRAQCSPAWTTCNLSSLLLEKTVENLEGNPVLDTAPGDRLRFTVRLCNLGTTSCDAPMADLPDNLQGNNGVPPGDLEILTAPGTSGCPADGGQICEQGMLGSPNRTPLPVSFCGEQCGASAPRELYLCPAPGETLDPNECYYLTIYARAKATITQTECLCNQALLRGPSPPIPPPVIISIDPAWQPFGSGRGCADNQTCRQSPRCATCVRVNADPVMVGEKCVDTRSPSCGTGVIKAPGNPVTYLFKISNTGRGPATSVSFTDPLNFLSSTGQPCLDTTQLSVANLACSWGPCGAGDYARIAGLAVEGFFATIPAGGSVTFEVRSFVHAGGGGTCPNAWNATHVMDRQPVPIPTNTPTFIIQAVGALYVNSTKCFNTTSPCSRSATLGRGSPVTYAIRYQNSGAGRATNVLFSDDLTNLGVGCGVDPIGATCVPGAGCGAFTCTVTQQPSSSQPFQATMAEMPPGCSVDVVINARVKPDAANRCCNTARVDYNDAIGGGSFSTADACFDVPTPGVEITKSLAAGQSAVVGTGEDVVFDIVVRNLDTLAAKTIIDLVDTLPTCFQPFTCSPQSLRCTGGLDCGTCSATLNGFRVDNFRLAASGQPGDTITFTVTVRTGTTLGTCNNTATTDQPAAGPAERAVEVIAKPVIQVDKTPAPSQVGPNADAQFTIVIRNAGLGDATDCSFVDDVDATGCMILKRCDQVSPPLGNFNCDPGPPPGTSEVSGSIPLLRPNDTQTIVITVTSGPVLSTCDNQVQVTCREASGNGSGSIQIVQVGCDLNKVVTMGGPGPLTYSNDCNPPEAPRLPGPAFVSNVGRDDDLPDGWTSGPAGEVVLYQIDCPCASVILLSKNRPTGRIHITY